jgi:hypothetical protein
MPRGGARPGGGRRKGSVNRRTKMLRALAAEALESGVTPLEVMLENMRFFHAEAEQLLARITSGLDRGEPSGDLLQLLAKLRHFRLEAQRCAVDAAPYLHPRLSAVAVAGDGERAPIRTITDDMTVEEAAAAYAETLRNCPVPYE